MAVELPGGLVTPALVVDVDVMDRNIGRMAEAARSGGFALRPHAKTHKCPQIADRQLRSGANGLTVATLGEAEVFADAGADDLFVAYTLWPCADKARRLSRLAERVALFFVLSALAHAWVSGPGWTRYRADLAQQRNFARWVEYALSSSVMIWLIAQICSVTDVVALVAIFAVNACMILFGWLQEKYEVPGEGGWLPFVFGCFAGAVPWLLIALLLIRPGYGGSAQTPGFVYGIVVSLFVFFNVFALVQWLQYKRVGRWADYLVGERTYITLSLVAKSLLAWQVFAGTLAS